jgi:hypothetical protein
VTSPRSGHLTERQAAQADLGPLIVRLPEKAGWEVHYTQVTEPAHPDSKKLLDHWKERQESGGFVVGRDVPSRALSKLLHGIAILEPLSDGDDFQTRLAGSTLRRRFGQEITSKRYSEYLPPEVVAAHARLWLPVFATGEPHITSAVEWERDQARSRWEVVFLRVLARDEKSFWLMSGTYYFGDAHGRAGNRALLRV